MSTILTIAKREVTRLRSRFRGGSRLVVTLILAASFLIAYLAFREGAFRGRGLYRVGVSPDVPPIRDSRFDSVTVAPSLGYSTLEAGEIDVYVDGTQVIHSGKEKSLYAANALKLYLETQELARIGEDYETDRAFPLRVEIARFPVDSPPEDRETVVPSLMSPPLPFARVVTVSIYLLPIFFVSVFFISGFMDEKADRRITVLLSAPVSPFHIIVGKMLPYVVFTLASVIGITIVLQGDVLLALAIFAPVVLFTFAVYLMVPLVYRTFKDTTFITMFATVVITTYLIFPAMFSGVSDLSYISPLTLAVEMYRGQPFGLKAYLTSAASMYLIFTLSVYIGTRILNEEYLTRFRPLYRKVADAVYLAINRDHVYLSVTLLSAFLIPIVYMIQLVSLAISLNLPIRYAIVVLLLLSVVAEEIAKSVGIVTLIENNVVKTARGVVGLAFLSALGFLVGEKLLLFVSVSVVSESAFSTAIFNSGMLLIPLAAHFVFTTIVCLLTRRLSVKRYPYVIAVGAIIHALYNLYVIGVLS
ncbi:MAG: hypothetical protein B6I35_07025 [Anaerolineaceae bacterium 4572_32.2]|nr:MAG: hypothetical protein B6I35_07025 [Anaerolineaceae bacterium 4572_32.2]HEY72747.1 ABC transporter permease [Thermoflexia bacterium]